MSMSLEDLDERPGYISSALAFGPAALNGVVDESGILGYAVFMVDACGTKLGDAVASTDSILQASATPCCQPDTYRVDFTAKLPEGVTEVALMIVPNTIAGALPVGTLIDAVVDYSPGGTRGVGRVGSAACRHPPTFRGVGFMALMAGISCLPAYTQG